MTPEDLTAIELRGRRCAVCDSGRHWRRFEVVRQEGREPVVMCPGCRSRFGQTVPAPEPQETAPQAAPAAAPPTKPALRPRSPQPEDRLKRALRELPPG